MRLFALIVLLSVWAASTARAEQRRFGLAFASNRGFADERELRFAESDAERLASTLRSLGGFRPENLVVIKGAQADEVRRAIAALNARIRAAIDGGDEALLLVYYSGHGDSAELHLGPSGLPLAELRDWVNGSAAGFRLLIVDSCRSGGVTRVKGAAPAEPFAVALEDALPTRGFAAITSSGAGEDSQESDRLGGSVFTSALLSGLAGAADASGDGAITLHEAYAYAYELTVTATRATAVGPQHPTFSFDIKGKGSVVLTRSGLGTGWGALDLAEPGAYFFLRPDGAIALEATFDKGVRRVHLHEGIYGVERRARDHLLQGQVRVLAGRATVLAPGSLRRVEYAQAVRKGGSERSYQLAIGAGWALRGPLADAVPVAHGMGLAFDLHLPALTLSLDLAGSRTDRRGVLAGSATELGVLGGVAYPLDLGPLTVLLGVQAGAAALYQTFDTQVRLAPARTSSIFMGGPFVGLDLPIAAGLQLRVRGAFVADLFREGIAPPDSSLRLTWRPLVAAGLSWMVR